MHRTANDIQSTVSAAQPLACDLTALSPEERRAHEIVSQELFGSLLELRELNDGFAFCFDRQHHRLAMDFIARERLCCPFFTFGLELTPQDGPLWLRITGTAEVKAFLRTELVSQLQ